MAKIMYVAQSRKIGEPWRDIRNWLHYNAEVETVEDALEKIEWYKEAAARSKKSVPFIYYRIVKREIIVNDEIYMEVK